MPGVSVAEDGNKRSGPMTPGEIRQCVMDVSAWFARHVDTARGTPDDELRRFSHNHSLTLPLALEELYLGTSGIWFDDKVMCSLQEAAKLKDEIKGDQYFPFANDDDEGLLVVNCDDEAVYEYDLHDGLGVKICNSFSDYLEEFRNGLLADHFEFISGVGTIEKVNITRIPRGGK